MINRQATCFHKGFLTWTDGSHGRWKTWSSTTTTALFKDVEDDGHLLLCDENGREHRYAFKEVQYII